MCTHYWSGRHWRWTPRAANFSTKGYTRGEGHTPGIGCTNSGGHTLDIATTVRNSQSVIRPIILEPMCAHHIFSYSHLTKLYLTLERDCRCSLENGHCSYQLVTNLVKQSVPKCHPDVFSGDEAMVCSWETSFKGMVKHTDIVPDQELNYLRSYRGDDPQQLVHTFRKRHGDNATMTFAQPLKS